MLFSKKDVLNFLPHRDPFLFIDEVESVELPENLKNLTPPFTPQQLVGSKVICHFKVTNEKVKVLEGHFPGDPILPGVVQVEMMAQAASFVATFCIDKKIEDVDLEVALMGVDQARFRRPVIPPMDLIIHSKLMKVRGPVQVYECEIYCGEDLVSQSTIMASMRIK